jgi:hypothetical protein
MSVENEKDLSFLLKSFKWGILIYFSPLILILIMLAGIFFLSLIHAITTGIMHKIILISTIM